jgi:hypothetical protein
MVKSNGDRATVEVTKRGIAPAEIVIDKIAIKARRTRSMDNTPKIVVPTKSNTTARLVKIKGEKEVKIPDNITITKAVVNTTTLEREETI